jgi:hypothetical protein
LPIGSEYLIVVFSGWCFLKSFIFSEVKVQKIYRKCAFPGFVVLLNVFLAIQFDINYNSSDVIFLEVILLLGAYVIAKDILENCLLAQSTD